MFTLLVTGFCVFILILYWKYLDSYCCGCDRDDRKLLILSFAAVVFVLIAYTLENLAVYFNGDPFPREKETKREIIEIEESQWTVGESNS